MDTKTSIFLAALIMLVSSCGVQREVAYIDDAQRDTAEAILSDFASTVHPGDLLYIYVNSQTPESVVPFNEETNKIVSAMAGNSTGGVADGYLVSEEGKIVFPVLGGIQVMGMTHDSVAHEIENRLRDGGYVTDAVVSVSLMNFRVAVVGEVARPQEIHVPGVRLTIFEALALCGDLTMDGRRENVMVVRQEAMPAGEEGETTVVTTVVGEIDLTSKAIFDSPYYYLRSGDIVYVEPTDKKKRLATRDPDVPGYISLSVRVAGLVNQLFRLGYGPVR